MRSISQSQQNDEDSDDMFSSDMDRASLRLKHCFVWCSLADYCLRAAFEFM